MAVDKHFLLRQERVPKALLIMVIPAIIVAALNQINVIISTFFLGNFSSPQTATFALGASTISMIVVYFILAFAVMLAVGNAIYASQKLGAKQFEAVKNSIANTYVMAAIVYLFILICIFLFLPDVVGFLTRADHLSGMWQDPLYTNTYVYCLIMLLGFPAQAYILIPATLLTNEGKAHIIIATLLLQILLNILLSYFLISFVFYGSNYEAAGAAIATVLSQTVQATLLTIILAKKKNLNFRLDFHYLKVTKKWLSKVVMLGLPQLLLYSFFSIAVLLLNVSLVILLEKNIIVKADFEASLASTGIIIKLMAMMYIFTNGIVQGVQGFFAYQFGSKLMDRLQIALKYSFVFCICLGICFFAFFNIYSEAIPHAFSSNLMVVEQTILGLKVMSFTSLFVPVGHLCFAIFSSLGFTRFAVISSIVRDGFLFLSCCFFMPLLFGLDGASYAFPISLMVGSIFIIILFSFNVRKFFVIKNK